MPFILEDEQPSMQQPSAPKGRFVLEDAPAEDNTRGMSKLDLALAGIGGSFVNTAKGIQQLGAQLGNKISSNLVSDETVKNINNEVKELRSDTESLDKTGAGFAGNVVGQGLQLAVGGGALKAIPKIAQAAQALKGVNALAPAAVEGAAFAATQPVLDNESRLSNAGIGAAAGAVGQGIASGIGKVARGFSSDVSPELATLLKKADDMGIPVSADQVVNSKPLNAVRASLDYLPFSGSGAQREAQQLAYNKAIAKTIGETEPNITTALRNADKRLGSEFDHYLQNTNVKTDEGFLKSLVNVRNESRQELSDLQFDVIDRQLENIASKISPDGVIPADAAYNAKKILDRLTKGQDSSVANYADDIKKELFSALNKSLGPEDAAKFATTRRQYGNLKTIEKVAPKDASGDVSFANLANAVKTNNKNAYVYGKGDQELSDIARVGQQFLKDRIGNSGTAQRMAATGAILGGGSMLGYSPQDVALGLVGGRGLTKALGSNALRKYVTEGSKGLTRVSGQADKLLPNALIALANAKRE